MRILDVCAFYSPQGGGVKTYIEQKLAIGPCLGHDITILAPGDEYRVIERGPSARIVTLPSPRFPLDRNYWYFDDEPALHRELDRIAPDFVEVSSPWRSPLMVARWQGDVPRSLVMHADPLSAYAYRWLKPIFSPAQVDLKMRRYWDHLRDLGASFDRVVCASTDLSNRMIDGGVAHVATHKMGIEAGLFSPTRRDEQLRLTLLASCGLRADAHLFLAIGRLAPEKRWPMVVEAVTAASEHAPIGLAMFGSGREKQSILRASGGNPHIRLFEPILDRATFATLVASADALIHGCEAETFCMVAAEARASGLPLVVPDRGGAADHAGSDGFSYRSGDAAGAAEAIQQCLDAPHRIGPDHVRTTEDHFGGLFADYEQLANGMRIAA